jgi:hypothetical protein
LIKRHTKRHMQQHVTLHVRHMTRVRFTASFVQIIVRSETRPFLVGMGVARETKSVYAF